VRVALKALDADSDERMAAAVLEEQDEDLVADPVDMDMKFDSPDDTGKEGPS
jgi:hypothetical protein